MVRKPSPVEIAQVLGAVLTVGGLLMLLPLGWVCLIVGLAVLGVAVLVEYRARPTPTPTSPTDGS